MNSIVLDNGCSAAKVLLLVTVGILLSTMSWFPRTEALPVTTTTTATTSTMDGHLESHSRHKREAMSSIVNMTTIRYPCGLPESETSGPRSCDGCSSAVVYLRRAQSALNALLSTVDRDSCSTMSMNSPIRKASFTDGMSDTDKLKEMYRSLIHHVTYVTLAGKQHPEGSPMRQFERSLILVQDALLCKLGSNYAEFEPDIEAAGALDVSTSQEITDRTIRDCVVANSASGLIKLMMDNIALFEN